MEQKQNKQHQEVVDSSLSVPPMSHYPAMVSVPQLLHSWRRARLFSPSRDPAGGRLHSHPPAVLGTGEETGRVRKTELRAQARWELQGKQASPLTGCAGHGKGNFTARSSSVVGLLPEASFLTSQWQLPTPLTTVWKRLRWRQECSQPQDNGETSPGSVCIFKVVYFTVLSCFSSPILATYNNVNQ